MGNSNRQTLARGATTADSPTPDLVGDANVSIDVDALDCYRDIHGLPRRPTTTDPLWSIGIDRARRLFLEFDLPATFFVVGRDLEYPARCEQAQQLFEAGHELANHTYDHPYDLRHFSEPEIAHQINACDRIITDVIGAAPLGFRTPGYNISKEILAISRRAGHRYDASVFPCLSYWAAKEAVMAWRAIGGDKSRSSRTDPRTLLAKRQPYFPDPLEFWRPATASGPYVEIPVAAFAAGLIPVIGTSLHLLDSIRWERLWPVIDRSFPRFFNLEMHAIDFVDASDLDGVDDAEQLVARQPDLHISWDKKADRYRRILTTLCDQRNLTTLGAATANLSLNYSS